MRRTQALLSALALWAFSGGVQADPEITSLGTTVVAWLGDPAFLICEVRDIGNGKVVWKMVNHDFVIAENTRLIASDTVKYSILPNRDNTNFTLQILYVDSADQGHYQCFIKDTNMSITIHLDVKNVANLPRENPFVNKTDCCIDQGISSTCLPGCVPSNVDFEDFNAFENCQSEEDLLALSTCFSDGSNHDGCCLARGVPERCLRFCHDEIDYSTLTQAHLTDCYTSEVLDSLFDCFRKGSELLPSPPTNVQAFPVYVLDKAISIQVQWDEPRKNSDQVTGYIVLYKTADEEHHTSTKVPPTARELRLKDDIKANSVYQVYLVAMAQHGASLASGEIQFLVTDNTKKEQQEIDIKECCEKKGISAQCQEKLCSTKTWTEFSTQDAQDCFIYMDDVFRCLAGHQNHTTCCMAYGVSESCSQLCSGHPPVFDNTFLTCVFDMPIIDACTLEGYNDTKIPLPPTGLTLVTVLSDEAHLSFTASKTSNILSYVAQVSVGEGSEDFVTQMVLDSTQTMIHMYGLKAKTRYNVRVITQTSDAGSLPSNTVGFRTYPVSQPNNDPVVNQPVDYEGCCRDSGMPEECWKGCVYSPDITSYYSTRLATCMDHIGTVLSCAADGRNHTSCCVRNAVSSNCYDLCTMTQKGQLDPKLYTCVGDTSKAVLCFLEGIVDLPRYPNVQVTNVTSSTIELTWTQPETSKLIDHYIVEFGLVGKNKTTETTNITTYILQDLLSGGEYEFSVSSVNDNGTSLPSPTRTVFTLSDFKPPTGNESVPTGRTFWSSVEHCCNNSNISPTCVAICTNSDTSDMVTGKSQCQDDYAKMLSCYGSGQDHTVCCRQANLPSECLPLCAGHPSDESHISASCMSYSHREVIMGCLFENRDLVPGAPFYLTVTMQDHGTAEVAWARPLSCPADCTVAIHYWKEGHADQVMDVMNVISPHRVTDLDVDTFYVFTVTAQNSYGAGAAAHWFTLFLPSLIRDVKVLLDSPIPYVEQGQDATLRCSTNGFSQSSPLTYQWYFNTNRKLTETTKALRLPSINSDTDEGYYTCMVTDNFASSSDQFFLPIKYIPRPVGIGNPADSGSVGRTSKISCWFKGFPDSDEHQWMLNGENPLNQADSRYSFVRDPQYNTGNTAYVLYIRNTKASDYGTYSITVKNSFGRASCSVKLMDPAMTMTLPPARKQADPQACCKNSSMPAVCSDLCNFDIDLRTVVDPTSRYAQCLFHLEVLLKCGADGRDHTKCCKDSGVTPYCYPLCSANIPQDFLIDVSKSIECVAEADKIFDCAEEGHDFIPYPPGNVRVTKGSKSGTIKVQWDPPQYNRDYVQHYTVHFSTSGPNMVSEEHSVDKDLTEYLIRGAKPGLNYSVSVKSAGVNGTSSMPSDTAVLPYTDIDNDDDDDDDDDTVAIVLGVVLGVIVLLLVLVALYFFFRSRTSSSKRPSEAVTFENPGFGNQGSIKFQNMDEESFEYGRLNEDRNSQRYENPTAPSDGSSQQHTYDNPQNVMRDEQGISPAPATLDLSSGELTYS